MAKLTACICTHNPRRDYLQRTIAGLQAQTLPRDSWELLLIDNASVEPLKSWIDLSWHPLGRHLREERLGLTPARLRAIDEAASGILVLIDDDNVLDASYLEHALGIMSENEHLGAIGGKSLGEFEVEPALWARDFLGCLALRDLGDAPQTAWLDHAESQLKAYPACAPVGAGMVLRRAAALAYVHRLHENKDRLSLDRRGDQLVSGGDNDIVLTIMEGGWGVGYFPQLQLKHLISARRLTRDYLARLNRAISRSWVHVLDAHDIRPWQSIPSWTVLPRKLRAFFRYRAWSSDAAYVRWQYACGMFEGQSALSRRPLVNL